MLRTRLLEVYDRDLVDQILPFQPQHFFQYGEGDASGMHTIPGEESDDKIARELFEMSDEELLYKPPRSDKVRTDQARARG